MIMNLKKKQMYVRKLRFAASYRYLFIMLLKKIINYQENDSTL